MKAKVGISDILAREQSKMKLLSQCVKNGQQFKYNLPLSSKNDVNMMFAKIQKLSEEDQLTLMRKEVKFKKKVTLNYLQTLFSSSNTTSVQQRCTRTSWHCMQLIRPTKKPFLLKTSMKLPMHWPHYPLLSQKKPSKKQRKYKKNLG